MTILIPRFLKQIDRHLMLHHQVVWSTRIHYVLFYLLIAWVSAWGLVKSMPLSPTSDLEVYWLAVALVGIPSGLGLLYWLYKQSQYSIEGSFGAFKKKMEYLRLAIYFIGIGSFIGLPLATAYWILGKTASLVSMEELKADTALLNEGNIFFPDVNNERNDNIYLLMDCWTAGDEVSAMPEILAHDCKQLYKYTYFQPQMYRKGNHSLSTQDFNMKLRRLWQLPVEEQETIAQTYLLLIQKYGGDISKVSQKPIQAFKNRELGQLNNYEKQKVLLKLKYLQSHNEAYKAIKLPYALAGIALCIFAFSTMLQLYHGLGLKDFIISAVVTALVSVGVIAFSLLIFHEMYPVFFTALFTYIGSLIIGLGAKSAIAYSRIQAIALAFANFYTPFLLMLLAIIASAESPKGEMVLASGIIGCLVHAIFFSPLFWQLQTHVRSLPRSS